MAFDFPSSPAVGQVSNGYVWNGQAWAGNGNLAAVAPPSDAPPANPVNGQLWWETDSGDLFVWYNDGNTSQWVQISGPGLGDAPSDSRDYHRRNGVWRPAPVEMLSARVIDTATTYVEFDLPAEFTSFQLRWRYAYGSNTAAFLALQTRLAGVWQTSTYFWNMHYFTTSSHATWQQNSSGALNTMIFLMASAFSSASVFSGTVEIVPGEVGASSFIRGLTAQSGAAATDVTGITNTGGRIDGIRFLASVGDINKLRTELYGYRGV